ncbi:hypothetical protein M2160_009363 [Streptomyces sp. SAI-117]|jgi:hypothetical protein|nr:hypothetical protein [Streptomyces sp. SAI-041]MDH6574256.1 hypothetical protein [Streptomyces sp. SAI-117]MDH6581012.1 hypothetical protein [Streptomyces sp. SAI-133]
MQLTNYGLKHGRRREYLSFEAMTCLRFRYIVCAGTRIRDAGSPRTGDIGPLFDAVGVKHVLDGHIERFEPY